MRTRSDHLSLVIKLYHVQVDEFRHVGVIERCIHLLARERRDVRLYGVGLPGSELSRKVIE
ncbi:hypothetical protein BG842_26635 [Haladaptatus sp. W1]|nr:hypothetical protein BG842_26635 [Haladaptatus sp. W1]